MKEASVAESDTIQVEHVVNANDQALQYRPVGQHALCNA